MLSMIFLVIICILLIILLFIKINISIEYLRTDDNDRAILTFSIIKNLIKLDIPFIDISEKKGFLGMKFSKKYKIKDDKTVYEKEKSFISFSKLKDMLEKAYTTYYTYKDILTSVRNYLRKRIVCNDFIFHLEFGLGDAALTGIASGLVWGASYSILSIIGNHSILKNTDIKISPVFNEIKFHVKFYCIFTIRVVHIIIVFLIFLFSLFKVCLVKKASSSELSVS